jgi:rod shape-determining protein MreB
MRSVYSLDAGSNKTKICDKNGEIILNTSTAILKNSYNEITSYGDSAKQLLGKLPPDFRFLKPIRNGSICDYDSFVELLKISFFSKKIKNNFFKPIFLLNTSIESTVVEKESICEAVVEAGAAKAMLIDSPIAAALGSGININEAKGNMIVVIGAEHTEIAILSLSNLVFFETIDFSMLNISTKVKNYMINEHNLLLGQNTVEDIVCETMDNAGENLEFINGFVVGINVKSGMPQKIRINVKEVWGLILREINYLIESLKESMELIQPELIQDILERGIIFAGGMANYNSLVNYAQEKLEIDINVPDTPEYVCVRGNMTIFRNKDLHTLIQEVF